MFKRRTSRVHHRRQVIELQAKVVSPRIVWYSVLKSLRKMVRFAVFLAFLGAAAWGVKYGIDRGLLENEKFQLQAIELTPNPAIDERRLVQVAGIDLNGSLFDCDAEEIEAKLRALPELATVSVRREFPGTLIVQVTARTPHVWVSSPSHGIPARDPQAGLLVDKKGFAFHCPPDMRDDVSGLPVFELGEGGEAPAAGKLVEHPEFSRLNRLYQVACGRIDRADQWIDTLRQSRAWSLELVSHEGTRASFGLGDHERQMSDLHAALVHAREQDQHIASIELIPERNIPVVLHGEGAPRAILIDEPVPVAPPDRRSRDLQNLLNR
ncbi:FtsQ-type POTRA domain-containing protein [Luteolibacter flavescens]|uniref:FtsQ-type POTRA domain-containing protein n=1 Tax=Luteolibacter flavescens TaxID=1859460 RepID=A0ABT3FSW8_9BACT|nr:FtsQ-type POTRA domain-containing protein [Luteolibacter flavescens]MCW1886075.1 FtsQ-type POTRA domain-containing protein [Luteolibacter flavescens]